MTLEDGEVGVESRYRPILDQPGFAPGNGDAAAGTRCAAELPAADRAPRVRFEGYGRDDLAANEHRAPERIADGRDLSRRRLHGPGRAAIPVRRATLHTRAMRPFITLACLLISLPAAAQDIVVEHDVMIPMRDGVRLATDIYRPAVDGEATSGQSPVLLMRSPYGKDRARDVAAAEHFARHGYVAAVQDMRGRYGSEGAFTKYSDTEPADGYDTVEWLARQAWANGKVGMWGTSYGAHTASDAAKLAPPALAAILLNQGGMANAWDHAVRHGGAFELGRELTWVWRQIVAEHDDPVARALFEKETVEDWYRALPLREGTQPAQGYAGVRALPAG